MKTFNVATAVTRIEIETLLKQYTQYRNEIRSELKKKKIDHEEWIQNRDEKLHALQAEYDKMDPSGIRKQKEEALESLKREKESIQVILKDLIISQNTAYADLTRGNMRSEENISNLQKELEELQILGKQEQQALIEMEAATHLVEGELEHECSKQVLLKREEFEKSTIDLENQRDTILEKRQIASSEFDSIRKKCITFKKLKRENEEIKVYVSYLLTAYDNLVEVTDSAQKSVDSSELKIKLLMEKIEQIQTYVSTGVDNAFPQYNGLKANNKQLWQKLVLKKKRKGKKKRSKALKNKFGYLQQYPIHRRKHIREQWRDQEKLYRRKKKLARIGMT